MTGLGTGVFTAGSHTGPPWELIRQQMVPSERSSLEDLREELDVRDAVTRYYYAWDQGDLDATLAMFTDDCVLETVHGTMQGREAARQHYEERIRAAPHRFHYINNQVVRLSADRREALVTSYHHAILDAVSGPAKAVGGVSADQMVKTEGGWRIAARTASIDFSFDVRPSG
jgi:uncharacterized protein (TIGR02246 family)